MKIIFLDFDGVLIVPEYRQRDSPRMVVSDEAVRELNRVTRTTGAAICASSAYRGQYAATARRTLRAWGVRGRVVGVTPDLWGKGLNRTQTKAQALRHAKRHRRGHEIKAWLDAHPEVSSYVILDDGNDMSRLWRRLILTDFEQGLTPAQADRAIKMLGPKINRRRTRA